MLQKKIKAEDVPGLCWKEGRKIKKARRISPPMNLDELPFPAWELFDMKSYTFPKKARFPKDWMTIADREAENAVREFLKHLYDGHPLVPVGQNESISTYFPRLHTPTQAYIDWNWNCENIERFIFAFSFPYEGAKTMLGNQVIHIMDCRLVPGLEHSHPFFRGLVYRIDEQNAYIASLGGSLVVPLNKIVGAKLSEGDRLYTPLEKLGVACAFRPIYTAAGLKKIE